MYSGAAGQATSTGVTSAQDIANAAQDLGYTSYVPYKKGGKVGSDLADLQLHKLVG
jgi:hypothetical protein